MPDSKPTTIEETHYRLLQVLVPHRTFLCLDASHSTVVLKRLDADCLHRDQLHPRIGDRLARIRELAHPNIATLRSVERWNDQPCLVWVYLDGQTWQEIIEKPPANFTMLANSLKQAVSALHDLGIVHGNLHSKNIIVRPDGQVWLTDLSPYLYTDPAEDISAMMHLLGPAQLRQNTAVTDGFSEKISTYRITSMVAAAICILIGLIFAAICYSMLQKPVDGVPATFPSLRH